VKRLLLSAFLCFSLGCVVFTHSSLLQAQTVTSATTPLNLGSVNVCANSAPFPAAGCSVTGVAQFNVTAGGSLGIPTVLTLGASSQDFQLTATTCSGSVATGSSCTVTVTFAPQFSGVRSGAVQIMDQSGNVLATQFLEGTGLGPQLNFNSGQLSVLASSDGQIHDGLAVDAAGNIYYGNANPAGVYKIPVSGGAPVMVTSLNYAPDGLALDGAGNLYVTSLGSVFELSAGCENIDCPLTEITGLEANGIAVDPAGNVFLTESSSNRIAEIPRGCVYSGCAVTIAPGYMSPDAIALDNAGNLFVSDSFGGVDKINISSGQKTNIVPYFTLLVEGMAVDPAGDLYMAVISALEPPPGFLGRQIMEAPAGGGSMFTLLPMASEPWSLALDGSGNIFISNFESDVAVYELPRVQAPTYTFATTPVGTASADSPQAFPMQNTGNANLTLSKVTLDPLDNFVQAAGSGTPPNCQADLVLSPGAICDLNLSYDPVSPGFATFTGALLNNTGNTTSTQNIPVAGIGGTPGTSISFPIGFGYLSNTPYTGPPNLGLTLNGGAVFNNNALQLTDGGAYEAWSAFFSTPIVTAFFQTSFDFQLTGTNSPTPTADGFAFVLQNQGPTALGTAGGGLGYGLPSVTEGGTQITTSLAVKFDLYDNDGEGSSSTGFYLNGAAPTVPAIDLLPSGIDLHSGHVFHVVLIYDGSALNLTITDQMTKATFSTQFPANLAQLLGGTTAFAGFTGGAGLYTAVQNILNWQLTSAN
jgi:streptogramin lyase